MRKRRTSRSYFPGLERYELWQWRGDRFILVWSGENFDFNNAPVAAGEYKLKHFYGSGRYEEHMISVEERQG